MRGDFILDARHCEILPWMLDIGVPKHILELFFWDSVKLLGNNLSLSSLPFGENRAGFSVGII